MSIVQGPGARRVVLPTEGGPTGELPDPMDALVGIDGNAYSIMGTVARILRRAGATPAYEKEYIADATAGDYDELLAVSVLYLTNEQTPEPVWEDTPVNRLRRDLDTVSDAPGGTYVRVAVADLKAVLDGE